MGIESDLSDANERIATLERIVAKLASAQHVAQIWSSEFTKLWLDARCETHFRLDWYQETIKPSHNRKPTGTFPLDLLHALEELSDAGLMLKFDPSEW